MNDDSPSCRCLLQLLRTRIVLATQYCFRDVTLSGSDGHLHLATLHVRVDLVDVETDVLDAGQRVAATGRSWVSCTDSTE